jgi:hypothetical protein
VERRCLSGITNAVSGLFPNRNQTGDLFGISILIVLGCMQDDFRRGHKRWLFWLLGLGC